MELASQEVAPEDWAKAQNNLGVAYRDRGTLFGISSAAGAGDLRRAIACFEAALEVHKAETDPLGHVDTLGNLGLTLQAIEQLPEAYSRLQEAISVLRTTVWGDIRSGPQVKAQVVERWHSRTKQWWRYAWRSAQRMAHIAHGRSRRSKSAKAQTLAELLAARNALPKGNVAQPIFDELLQLTEAIY